jgi:hypothetical protein
MSENPFQVTGYFHDEDNIMDTYMTSSQGYRKYYIDGRQVSFDEWNAYQEQHQRIGREQRDRYIDHLSEMYSQEYLTQEEFQERSAKAAEAKFKFDLASLVKDLPPLQDKPKSQPPAIQGPSQQPVPEPRKHLSHAHKVAIAWTVNLLATLGIVIPVDVHAAGVYHGLFNSPGGYAVLTLVGVISFLISLFAAITYWRD